MVKGDRHTDRHVQSNMPLLFQRGHKYICLFSVTRHTLRFSADPKAFYLVFVVPILFNTFEDKWLCKFCLLAALNELKLQIFMNNVGKYQFVGSYMTNKDQIFAFYTI